MISRDEALKSARLYYRPLPDELGGQCWKDGSGYAVTINSRKPAAQQREFLDHELAHIRLGHLDEQTARSKDEHEKEVFALVDAESGHKRYYRAGADLLRRHLGETGFNTVFYHNGRKRWACIVEQIGKMYLQNNYRETDCTQTADKAITYLQIGFAMRDVEQWIRQGRIANEW